MCIRDSLSGVRSRGSIIGLRSRIDAGVDIDRSIIMGSDMFCLLYTSDAADERSSVDLGGRRIIKKKNNKKDNNNCYTYRYDGTTIEQQVAGRRNAEGKK